MFEKWEARSNKLAEVREHVRQVHSIKNLGLGVHITDEYAETLAIDSSLLRCVLVCHYYYLQLGDSNSDVSNIGQRSVIIVNRNIRILADLPTGPSLACHSNSELFSLGANCIL